MLVAMAIAAIVGTWGLLRFPLPVDNVFLALLQVRKPFVLDLLAYG